MILLHIQQPLLNCSIKNFESINLNPTLLSKQLCDSSRHRLCSSIACLALSLETKLAGLASLFYLQNWSFHLDWDIFSSTGLIPYPLLQKFWSLFPLDQRSDESCLIFPSASQLALIGKWKYLNMKTKKVDKVITTLKDWIGHPLKRHLTETLTWVNNLNFFSCAYNTVVRFVPVVTNFKPTITFVSWITEVKSHFLAKLSPIFGQRWQRIWT